MSEGAVTVDAVFRALADPTRRRVVERLGLSPATAMELAAPFKMALASFTQHLHVLEAAGLVSSKKQGRARTYTLSKGRLQVAEGWLMRQRSLWERRLDQLDELLIAQKEKEL
jgi:DNA-binding transcriptional ArsR family regulator